MMRKLSVAIVIVAVSTLGAAADQSMRVETQTPGDQERAQSSVDLRMRKSAPNGQDVSSEKRAAIAEKLIELYGSSSDMTVQASVLSGTIAIGVIVDENDGELLLDREPCNKRVEIFRKPYRSTALGKKQTCGDKEFELYEVRQQ